MKVVVVSGIWPPDPGGPASHAPALADFLVARGHTVEVVTTADEQPAERGYRVRWAPRRHAAGRRHLECVSLVATSAARSDVVYATSMIRRAAIGSDLARHPLVVKLVSDEAYEREARTGRFTGTLEDFQRERGDVRVRALRGSRTAALRRARHIFCPSAYLREIALGWGLEDGRCSVLPNPAPHVPDLPNRELLRAELEIGGPMLAFAGRLGPQKALGVALDAIAKVPDVTLAIAGDGPDRPALERRARDLGVDGRALFLGSRSRGDVLRLFRAADASLLSSSWENLPHTVLEALAVGSPVISTAVGGVPEIVRDGENGLLVPPGDPGALAHAIRRFFDDDELRRRLAEAAAPSVAGMSEEFVFARIEDELVRAARS